MTTTATIARDILQETVISLSQAAARLPGSRGSGRTHPSTILRWVTRGTPLPDGTRIRLEGVRCGSRWCTSVEALARYTAVLTAASAPTDTQPAQPIPRSPAQRRRASDIAARRADELLA
jgi:hypothetical protein